MSRFEYKVVPAPERARPGLIAGDRRDRYASTLTEAINALAEEGWTFLRTDRLPYTVRGFLGRKIREPREVMVFQRPATAGAVSLTEAEARLRAGADPDAVMRLADEVREDLGAIPPLRPVRDAG